MHATSRFYRDETDLRAMCALASAAVADLSAPSYYHPGDVCWQIKLNPAFDPTQRIRLWEDERGELLAFILSDSPSSMAMQVSPALTTEEDTALQHEMLTWAAEHLRAADLPDGEHERVLEVRGFVEDATRVGVFAAQGFVMGQHVIADMRRELGTLDTLPSAPTLPEGWSVRHVHDDEFEERVAAHRDVWHSVRLTLDSYLALRATPYYVPELDVAAVAPDGTIASYAICWWDPATRTGQFEPVGTREAFRQRGLGKAVLIEAMRRLVERGAVAVRVVTNNDNVAAMPLYASVGFIVQRHEVEYTRRV